MHRKGSFSSATWNVLTLVACGAALVCAHIWLRSDLPGYDVATYSLIGREIAFGGTLYYDVWDIKPPGMFAVFAVAHSIVSGHGSAILITGLAGSLAVLAIAFMLGRLHSPAAGRFAAVFWTTVALHPSLDAMQPNTEVFINLCMGVATLLALKAGRCSDTKLLILGAVLGLFLFFATTFKQVAAIQAVAVLILLTGSRRGWIAGLVAAAHFVMLWVFTFTLLSRSIGAREVMILLVEAPGAYAGDPMRNLLAWPLSVRQLIDLSPLLILTIGAMLSLARWDRNRLAVGLILVAGAWVAAIVPGQGFAHYAQLLMFPAVVITSWGVATAGQQVKNRSSRVAIIAGSVIGAAGVVLLQLPIWMMSPRDRAIAMNSSWFVRVADVATELNGVLREDEQIFSWADEPQLYVLTDRRPVAPALWRAHTLKGPQAQTLSRRTIERLRTARPDVVILWAFDEGPNDHEILRWVHEMYDPMPGNERRLPLSVFIRRNSDLATRTGSSIR